MALDDIKKADEIISMAVLGPTSGLASAPAASTGKTASSSSSSKRRNFWSTLSLQAGGGGGNKKKRPQRQYSNAFPCPMIRSDTLDSPEGSVSSLGLVHSAPFASLAMTSVHARRARSAYRAGRAISDQTTSVSAQNEVSKTTLPFFLKFTAELEARSKFIFASIIKEPLASGLGPFKVKDRAKSK